MKTAHKIAYDYAMAMIAQRANDTRLDQALRLINPDNQVFGLADAVEGPYTELVAELLGPELFDWLMWWMYETNCGQDEMEFTIDNTPYNPQDMTLYKFLEIVDAS